MTVSGEIEGYKTERVEKEDDGEDEREKKDHWAKKAEFLLAVTGDIIRLGTGWRCPYLCYRNSGGKSY